MDNKELEKEEYKKYIDEYIKKHNIGELLLEYYMRLEYPELYKTKIPNREETPIQKISPNFFPEQG